MKKSLLPLLFLCTAQLASGQDIPEPDFNQRPYFLQDGKLMDLEKADATMERKMKGMGYGGVEYYYSVDGTKSNIRFSSSSLPKLVIKVEDNTDPTELYSLCAAEVKKNSRRFKTLKMGVLGELKSTDNNKLAINAKKLREKVFEMVVVGNLPTGEFALVPQSNDATKKILSTGGKVCCFGID